MQNNHDKRITMWANEQSQRQRERKHVYSSEEDLRWWTKLVLDSRYRCQDEAMMKFGIEWSRATWSRTPETFYQVDGIWSLLTAMKPIHHKARTKEVPEEGSRRMSRPHRPSIVSLEIKSAMSRNVRVAQPLRLFRAFSRTWGSCSYTLDLWGSTSLGRLPKRFAFFLRSSVRMPQPNRRTSPPVGRIQEESGLWRTTTGW